MAKKTKYCYWNMDSFMIMLMQEFTDVLLENMEVLLIEIVTLSLN